MKLLVVEDEGITALFLQRGLAEEGFAVDVAYDGGERQRGGGRLRL
jgi:DNA-binding response OmpR family regulator